MPTQQQQQNQQHNHSKQKQQQNQKTQYQIQNQTKTQYFTILAAILLFISGYILRATSLSIWLSLLCIAPIIITTVVMFILPRPPAPKLTGRTPGTRAGASGGGISWLNILIADIWQARAASTIDSSLRTWLNTSGAFSTVMDSVELGRVESGKGCPEVIGVHVRGDRQHTVLEAELVYVGGLRIFWTMRPRVLPLNLSCELHSITVHARIVLDIRFFPQFEGRLYLAEYPTLNSKLRIFGSLDFNAISPALPSVSERLRHAVREAVESMVSPEYIVLFGAEAEANNRVFNMSSTPDTMDMLEDEIRSSLLNIDNLLKTAGEDAAGRESVARAIVQFLKLSAQPRRVPLSMLPAVRRAFSVLESIMADSEGNLYSLVMNILTEDETIRFLADTARKCTLADQLIMRMMSARNPEIRKQVNTALRSAEADDVPLKVINRIVPSNEDNNNNNSHDNNHTFEI